MLIRDCTDDCKELIEEFLEDLNKCVNIYQYKKLRKKWEERARK